MTLRELNPGDRFTLIRGDLNYEVSYSPRPDIAVSCRILGNPYREHDLIAPSTEVLRISTAAERRIASQEPDAECDPMLGGA